MPHSLPEWTFASAWRDAFGAGLTMMECYQKINTLSETERDESAAMLRELDYDFL